MSDNRESGSRRTWITSMSVPASGASVPGFSSYSGWPSDCVPPGSKRWK